VRDRVLSDPRGTVEFLRIDTAAVPLRTDLAAYYADRSRYSFLRRDAGLGPRGRFGVLEPFAPWLDRLPEGAKRAASSLLGSTGRVFFYRDLRNASLKGTALFARTCLLIFVLSLAGVFATALRIRRARRSPATDQPTPRSRVAAGGGGLTRARD